MIIVGDIVNVSLAGGGLLSKVEVTDIPGNNMIYWTFEDSDGVTWLVGPSMVAMEKVT